MLIVEDNEADVFLIEKAIGATNLPLSVHIVKDGDQAVRFFDRADADPAAPRPAVVILDINLPKRQGGDVLKHLRGSPKCGKALVIVVSTSGSQQDRAMMKRLGANEYFRKPSAYDEFMKLGDMVKALLDKTVLE